MKLDDENGKIASVTLSEIYELLNTWRAVAPGKIIPFDGARYAQLKQSYELLLDKIVSDLGRKGVPGGQELDFGTIARLTDPPVEPVRVLQAVASIAQWINLPEANEAPTVGVIKKFMAKWLRTKEAAGLNAIKNLNIFKNFRQDPLSPKYLNLSDYMQFAYIRFKENSPELMTFSEKINFTDHSTLEQFERLIYNAMARTTGGDNALVTFTPPEATAYRTLQFIAATVDEDTSHDLDIKRILERGAKRANLSKKITHLRRMMAENLKKIEDINKLVNQLSTSVDLTNIEIQKVEAELKKLNPNNPNDALSIDAYKQQLNQHVNQLSVLSKQISLRKEDIVVLQRNTDNLQKTLASYQSALAQIG